MLNTLRRALASPAFSDDENKTRSAYYINIVTLITAPLLFLLFLGRILLGVSATAPDSLIILGMIVVLALGWWIMRMGAVRLAGYITVSLVWVASTLLAFTGSGLRGTGFISYFVVMLLAGLLVGVRTAIGVAVLSIVSAFGLAYVESIGRLMDPADPPFEVAVKSAVIFIICAFMIRLIMSSLQNALTTTTMSARQLETTNKELIELRDILETRVQDRTASLEKRAGQLQTVSSLARSIAAMQELSQLLPNIARLVSEQFGFYHTGIFLLEETRTHAVLQAANSEGGRRMLARGHQLPIDSQSIVGYAAARGEPRIALDVGTDAVYFDNHDLPETRSEMALPLRVSGKVIGVLDVQSTVINAFSEDDFEVLSTLADQIAMAIENARLLGEAQKSLAEARSTFAKYVRQEWSNFAQQTRTTGFVFDGKLVSAIDNLTKRDQPRAVLQTGSLVFEKGAATSTVSVPIKLRGQVIGVLDVRSKRGPRDWSREEIMLLEAAAERAALALENARLLESAQRRAARERTIGEISAKIGTASDFNSILRATVEEMGRRIGAAEVVFELDSSVSQNGGEH
jgi:GAF domain-containing protein